MPGPQPQGHVLDGGAVAADQQVGRDPHRGNGTKVGVSLGIEAIVEQVIDPAAAEFPGG
jgi:hypothetical protein